MSGHLSPSYDIKHMQIMFHVPNDEKLLAAVGDVAVRHEQLNHILRLTIKSLTGVTQEEAIAATAYESSSGLRERVRKLARKRLGDGTALVKLQAFVAKCERLTTKRNQLIHGLWAEELDGEAHIRDAHGEMRPVPRADELEALAGEIGDLTWEINVARLKGFLFEALQARSSG